MRHAYPVFTHDHQIWERVMSRKDRERAYVVQMYGLAEERRVCRLPWPEVQRRQREIWEACFG